MTESAEAAKGKNGAGTSVILNAIEVLRCFTVEAPLLGVTEIAARVGLHKSTVSRILATLEQENLVERDPTTRRFQLGLGLIAVTGPLLAELDVRRAAYPALQALTARTGETSALLIWDGSQAFCVEQIASPQQVKHTTPLGTRYNTALSSSVQIFLADAGPEQTRTLLRDGKVLLPNADDLNIEKYLARLRTVSSVGYAINYGETSSDEVGIAAPVFDHRDHLAACVLLAAPRFRVPAENLQSMARDCAHAAKKITTRLGGHHPG
jgi:DNA-binding IclR family transcriptional regulator